MIQLNVDFSLLNKYFGISPSKIQQYANKDFEEIMKLEAQQGNEQARNYQQILSDPDFQRAVRCLHLYLSFPNPHYSCKAAAPFYR